MKENGKTALVQGASRGIGLEFVRQLVSRADVSTVIATCRRPDSAVALQSLAKTGDVRVLEMDIEHEISVRDAADNAIAQVDCVNLMVNCAGLLHDASGIAPERRLEQLDARSMQRSFAVNATGPALVVKHFRPLLSAAGNAVVANLSARVGSISDNRLGGWYAYRASKAAQNMLTRCMAIELGRGNRPITLVALHPGTVDTDLSKPFQNNVPTGKLFDKECAVTQLLGIIDSLTPADSGRFIAWDGSEIPW